MPLNRRLRDPQQISHLTHRPLRRMQQPHHHPLPFRQPSQGPRQPRLHPQLTSNLRPRQHHPTPAITPSSPTAANPIQIPRRVPHRRDPIPMLPPIRQRLRRSLPTNIATQRRRQRHTQTRLMGLHELRERLHLHLATQHPATSRSLLPNTRRETDHSYDNNTILLRIGVKRDCPHQPTARASRPQALRLPAPPLTEGTPNLGVTAANPQFPAPRMLGGRSRPARHVPPAWVRPRREVPTTDWSRSSGAQYLDGQFTVAANKEIDIRDTLRAR